MLPLPLSPAWTIFLSSTFYSSYFILLTFHLVVFFTLTFPLLLLSGTFYSQVKQNIFFRPSFPSVSYQKYYHTVYEVFYFCAEHMLSIQSLLSFFVLIPSRTFKSISIGCTDDGFNSILTFQMCSEYVLRSNIVHVYVCLCLCARESVQAISYVFGD